MWAILNSYCLWIPRSLQNLQTCPRLKASHALLHALCDCSVNLGHVAGFFILCPHSFAGEHWPLAYYCDSMILLWFYVISAPIETIIIILINTMGKYFGGPLVWAGRQTSYIFVSLCMLIISLTDNAVEAQRGLVICSEPRMQSVADVGFHCGFTWFWHSHCLYFCQCASLARSPRVSRPRSLYAPSPLEVEMARCHRVSGYQSAFVFSCPGRQGARPHAGIPAVLAWGCAEAHSAHHFSPKYSEGTGPLSTSLNLCLNPFHTICGSFRWHVHTRVILFPRKRD